MSILTAVIYGLVQGVLEFFPVSSSAHMRLLPNFLGVPDPGKIFDLSMNIGTVLAIIFYFRNEIKNILKDFFFMVTFQTKKLSKNEFLMKNLAVSTFSTFLGVVILKKSGLGSESSFAYIAINLIIFGLLMGIVDFFSKDLENIMFKKNLKKSFLIGLVQALAIIPGASRLGVTMTMLRFFKCSRTESARYSFLLSIPLVVGGLLIEYKEAPASLNLELIPLLVGGVISFLVGLLTLNLFLKYIEKIGLIPFTVYRVLFGIYLFLGGLPIS